MKKIALFISTILLLPTFGYAEKAPRYSYAKDMYGDLNVGYSARPVVDQRKYYVGGRADVSFLNWTNGYDFVDETGRPQHETDSFSFEPVVGLDLFIGYKFSDLIRADVELGYIGEYKKSETEYNDGYIPEKTTFDFETYYATINGYYNFKYGLYVGAGFGVAMTNLALDHTWYDEQTKKHVSPMAAVMFGWTYTLDEDTDFDLRYRLSVFNGGNVTMGGVKIDMGYVMNNSLSAGIRCYF